MPTFDIATILNSHLACARCRAHGSWATAARPTARQNSVIHQLCCRQCGERVVAKVGGGKQRRDDDRAQLHHEYATLRTLESAFPQDGQIGILEPLGYVEAAGRGIMVTRWVAGTNLVRYARHADSLALERAFESAGTWLRKLHGADDQERPLRSLGVAEKLDDLLHSYGKVLRAQPGAWKGYELLASAERSLDALMAQPVRLHGDFKPQNMLYDNTRCVGLDINWRIISLGVYDLAPFLNHLWLAGAGWHGWGARKRYLRAEKALLAGYGGATPMCVLRWAQLYFALCHLGGYRQRGGLAVVYAKWKIWPLVRRLQDQLRQCG